MGLTDVSIRQLKAKPDRYAVTDSRGLSIEIFPSGGKSWRYRYRLNGKNEKMALGRYPTIGLKEARMRRDDAARVVANGGSPATEKQRQKFALDGEVTVKNFAERYYSEIVVKDRKNPLEVRRVLDNDILPVIGSRPVRSIDAMTLQKIIFRKRDHGLEAAAAKMRNLMKRLFDYAIVCGLLNLNPAGATPTRFITRARPRTRALSPEEIRIYIRTVDQSNVRRQFKLALHILLHTLVRKSMLLDAVWSEIDFEKRQWSIPKEKTKTGQAHVVYLSNQVCALFQEVKYLAGDSQLVLPGRNSLVRPFAKNVLNQCLDGLNFNIPPFTIHDLRRTGSTILHEQGFPSDVIEKVLSHTIGGVRGVYNRAEYAEQRTEMLQKWSDYVENICR